MKQDGMTRRMLQVAVVVALAALYAGDAFGCTWVFTGYGWKHFEWPLPPEPPPVAAVNEVYIFSSASDATLDSPDWPPWVLGSTGPWSMSLVDVDPDGNPMPFTGMKFSLDSGGVPVTSEKQAWFITPFVTPDPFVFGQLTRFHGNSSTGEFTRYLGTGLPHCYPDIPPELTEPEDVYQYIVDTCPGPTIPTLTEWGAIIFCIVLCGWMAWVIVHRRRVTTQG